MKSKVFYLNDNQVVPKVTFVVPVHNQVSIICEVIKRIAAKAELPHDLVIITDNCRDGSNFEVSKAVESLRENKKTNIVWHIDSRISLFETKSDHIGFTKAETEYVIEIQADMLINQDCFDLKLIAPLLKFDDLIAISGRCCHKFEELSDNIFSKLGNDVMFGSSRVRWLYSQIITCFHSRKIAQTNAVKTLISDEDSIQLEISDDDFFKFGKFGKLGALGEYSVENVDSLQGKVWLSETVNRGPLAIDLSKYNKVDGFNRKAFFLGMDEHDLFYRAWRELKYRTGYVPIDYYSPLDSGSTRKKRKFTASLAMFLNSVKRKRFFEGSDLVRYLKLDRATNSDLLSMPTPEIRKL